MRIDYDGKYFWTSPHETDPELLILNSRERDVLEDILASIELQGVAEGRDFDDLAIYRETDFYSMVVDRSTLVLYFTFEAHYNIERKGPYLAN